MTEETTRPRMKVKDGKDERKSRVFYRELTKIPPLRVPDVDVRKIRMKMGLTQEEFAERYGLGESSVKNWEAGRKKPQLATRIMLKALEIDPMVFHKLFLEDA